MGNASSSENGEVVDAPPTPIKTDQGQPARFDVTPLTSALKARGSTLVLEVDTLGFRLLKPKTLDALNAFGSQKIVEYDFKLQQVDMLLAKMEVFIEAVMSQRRAQAISDADFEQLVAQLEQSPMGDRSVRIATAAQFCFFTSLQGTMLMDTVDNTFDKMDVAVALHHRLIDQTEFATLLCCLECQEDRDNVWHRILASKAHKQPVCPSS
ncbi:MAG: hypothetical protein FRX49_04091 [Trebouxia sp. A1-2]|nr:MAG: hypothetical protein FRX49_04091 [Trebouxia sp. A1-2]